MELDLSFSFLFAGLVFGVFGVYFIRRGKELGNIVKVVVGIALLVFTYVVPSPWCWLVGFALMFVGAKA